VRGNSGRVTQLQSTLSSSTTVVLAAGVTVLRLTEIALQASQVEVPRRLALGTTRKAPGDEALLQT